MTRLVAIALPLACLAALAGSSSAARRAPPQPSLTAIDPDHARTLPVRGVVVQRKHDLLLIGLDGRAYGRLVGFRASWQGGIAVAATPQAYAALGEAVGGRIAIVYRGSRWYALEPGGVIRRLTSRRLPLAGGIDLVAHTKTFPDGGVSSWLTADRGAKVVMPGPGVQLTVSPSGLLSAGRTVLDPATGTRWKIDAGCAPAAVANGRLLAVCADSSGKSTPHLVAFTRAGGRRALGRFPTGMFSVGASLSPDRRYVGAELAFGCGPQYSFVIPARGGTGRSMLGQRRMPFRASSLLGWSADSRVVAYVDDPGPSDCEHSPPAGVYSIDPATFSRRLLARRYGQMWGSDAAR